MSMMPTNFPFGKDIRPFRYGEVETPFSAQGQLYDIPIGRWRHKAYIWRLVFFVNMSIIFLLTLILILILNSNPFSVTVSEVTSKGYVKDVGALKLNQKPSNQMFESFLEKSLNVFVSYLAQHKNLNDTSKKLNIMKFWSEEAKSQLNSFLVVQNVDQIKVKNCQFTGNNVLECALQLKLGDNSSLDYIMTAKINQTTPQNERVIYLNPLGINVENVRIKPIMQQREGVTHALNKETN